MSHTHTHIRTRTQTRVHTHTNGKHKSQGPAAAKLKVPSSQSNPESYTSRSLPPDSPSKETHQGQTSRRRDAADSCLLIYDLVTVDAAAAAAAAAAAISYNKATRSCLSASCRVALPHCARKTHYLIRQRPTLSQVLPNE